MNIEALLITGSIIFITITLAFAIRIVILDEKIDKLKGELYELEKKIEEYEKGDK